MLGAQDDSGQCSFDVLGFPSNQFGTQEPGSTPEEIMNGLKYVRPGNGFVPMFKLFEKGDVNGAKENPLFTHLKRYCPLPGGVIANKASDITWSPVRNDDIAWNFQKFLIDHNGKVRYRYLSSVNPVDLMKDIQKLQAKCRTSLKQSDVYSDYY